MFSVRSSGAAWELVSTGVYPRNSTAVKSAILQLRTGQPEAVVLVGAYEPVARMIAWSHHIGFSPLFLTISFVGTSALVRELGPDGVGVYVTQVVSSPVADNLRIAAEFRQALATYDPDAVPDFVSFEGYLAGAHGRHGGWKPVAGSSTGSVSSTACTRPGRLT